MTDLPVILLAFANEHESGRYLARLSQEQKLLWASVNKAEKLCKPELVINATLDDIDGVFEKYKERVAIFHYGGHANENCLLLTSSSENARETDLRGLLGFWGRKGGLRLVFLNGCSTQPQVDDLLQAGVSAVIATARPINDGTACGLADRFYGKLVAGFSIRNAFELARENVNPGGRKLPRDLILNGSDFAPEDVTDDRGFPWDLRSRDGSNVEHISLPELAGDPLFGLPGLSKREHLPDSPYRGLKRFTRKDAAVFFGRGQAIRELYNLATSPSGPVILYSGPTGVGKSSILDAGLVPRLAPSHEVLYFRRDPDLGLLGTLGRELGSVVPDAVPNSRLDFARLWRDREQPDRPLVAILDQAEEVFTRPMVFVSPDNDHAALGTPRIDPVAELAELLFALRSTFASRDEAARPLGKLILALRSEWLESFEGAHDKVELGYERLLLAPLDHSGIIEAIEGPIRDPDLQRHYGLSIESTLAQRIAGELEHDAGAALAPTLQVLLTNLWKSGGGKGARFTEDLYERLKDRGLLLKDVLDLGLEALSVWRPELVSSGFALDLLEHHATPMDTAETRTRADLLARYPHRADVLEDCLRTLEQSYLLVPAETQMEGDVAAASADQPRPVAATTRLGHDTLAPLVREKFRKSDAPGQRARRLLENRAPEWRDGRIGTVLDRADLDTVEEGVSGMRAWDADDEDERETRLVQGSRRKQTLRRLAYHLSTCVAVAAVWTSLATAFWQRGMALEEAKNAQKQAKRAEDNLLIASSRRLAALSTAQRNRHLDLSLILAVEALRPVYTFEARDSLYRALQEEPGIISFLHAREMSISCITLSPDGKTLAAGYRDGGGVVLWDMATHQRLGKPLPVKEGYVTTINFSPDGKTLAAGYRVVGGAVVLWDVATRQRLTGEPLRAESLYVESIAFSPDGKTLAAGYRVGFGSGVVLWDVATRQRLAGEPLTVEKAFVVSISFSSDSKTLAAGYRVDGVGGGSGVVLWDVATRRRLAGEPLTVEKGDVVSIAFSSGGKTLAAGYGVGGVGGSGVVLWDVATRQRLAERQCL
jgi:hypothetical protein